MSNPEKKLPYNPDHLCKNCNAWIQFQSNPVMGKCQNPESAANNSQMYKHSYCSEIILKEEVKK